MDERRLTVIVVPDGESETRSYRIPYGRLKLGVGIATVVLVVFIVMAASWWYVAAQAARVPGLERQVAELEAERAKVTELARTLSQVEAQYERVRQMLGADGASSSKPDAPALLPLRDTATAPEAPRPERDASLPTSWPLTVAGYITQALRGAGGDHPGIDVAVPKDSYIRAAGAGRVVKAGPDDVYGEYVVIDHGDGYQTLYGHASRIFVRPGERVERDQVIALTGSTGRSTAPHLHFEVRRNGQPVDPLKMVQRP